MTDQHYQQLLDSLIAQANYFLEESGAFYPYGSVMDADLQLRPLGYYPESEYPDSEEVLNQLEEAVKTGLQHGKYLAAVIGVDVLINVPGRLADEKKSAVQVRSYSKDGSVMILYSCYVKHEGGYEFGELFEL